MVAGVLIDYGVYANSQGDQRDDPDTHQVVFAICIHCSDFTIFYLDVIEAKFRCPYYPNVLWSLHLIFLAMLMPLED